MDKKNIKCLTIFILKIILSMLACALMHFAFVELAGKSVKVLRLSFCLYVLINAIIYLRVKKWIKLLNLIDCLFIVIFCVWGIHDIIIGVIITIEPFILFDYPPFIGMIFYGIIGILLNREVST
jgi:hypothetical protein